MILNKLLQLFKKRYDYRIVYIRAKNVYILEVYLNRAWFLRDFKFDLKGIDVVLSSKKLKRLKMGRTQFFSHTSLEI